MPSQEMSSQEMPFHERPSHPRPWARFVPRQPPSNSPLFRDGLGLQHDRGRPVEAPKLDAIRGIVNMPWQLPWSAPCGDAIGVLACDKRSNKNIGRNAMGRWFGIAAAAVAMFAAGGVASAAGGGVDILARTLGDVVSRQWVQTVVVENRPGAGGVVASQALAAAPPDGYTLIVVASGHATNPFLYEKLPYDTFRDFTPISLLASSPNILLVKADSPFKTVAHLIGQARAKPGSLAYGHAGNGTSTHLAGELLKNLARIDMNAIPYK